MAFWNIPLFYLDVNLKQDFLKWSEETFKSFINTIDFSAVKKATDSINSLIKEKGQSLWNIFDVTDSSWNYC